jgi:hypothetical protein
VTALLAAVPSVLPLALLVAQGQAVHCHWKLVRATAAPARVVPHRLLLV